MAGLRPSGQDRRLSRDYGERPVPLDSLGFLRRLPSDGSKVSERLGQLAIVDDDFR